MDTKSIYRDIAERTGGNIYIGVVGPVRSGKSTFIHKLLDTVVLPNIENEYDRVRTNDEAPMSGGGRTITTTEPKFVPDDAVKIKVDGGVELKVKLIDCVGYLVKGAIGADEDGEERMIKTPWDNEELPFSLAAELGTGKVIREHSTIAILVTTDGSISDIPRENYVPAEERAAKELEEAGKPYAIILNSRRPESDEARALAESLEEKYSAPVALVNCTELNSEDMREILGLVLSEFPVKMLEFSLPTWCEALSRDHKIITEAKEMISTFSSKVRKLGDIKKALPDHPELFLSCACSSNGTAFFDLPLSEGEFYTCISESCGHKLESQKDLFIHLVKLSGIEREYKKVEKALSDVKEKGYGIVMPDPEDMELDEPMLAKHGGGWGVKLSARADSIHMIRTELKTELCPVVGTAEQTEEVVKYLTNEYEEDKDKLLESNMFGKSIYDLVKDGMNAKLLNIPDESREKLGETLERVVNEGANGLICILL